jgi:hypothetical protein
MRAAQFLAIIGRGSKGSNALENTEDRAGATSEQQDNVINTVNSLDPYGPSWQLVPGNVAAGTVYAQVPTSGTGDLTFTRASTATRTDSAGNIVDVASGVGRVHYRNADGSVSSTGRLLLEPQRTNSIRNSTMVGAVAGSPGSAPNNWISGNGGLTRTIVNIGTELGLPYVDIRLNGTASGAIFNLFTEGPTQVVASNGQTWTNSFYMKLVSAPNPYNSIQNNFSERTAAGTLLTGAQQTITLTSNLTRFSFTRTNTNAATERINAGYQGSLTIGTAYDFTIRIAAPQMELGAYATTFIKTSTAAVTRVADNFDKTGVNTFLGANSGTWFIEIANNTAQIRDASSPNQLSLSNLSSDIFELRNLVSTSSRLSARIALAGSAIFTTLINTDRAKIAFVYNGSTGSIFINGVKVTSTAFAVTSFDRLRTTTTDNMKQLEDMALIPRALPDAEAIQITTL